MVEAGLNYPGQVENHVTLETFVRKLDKTLTMILGLSLTLKLSLQILQSLKLDLDWKP